MQVAEHRTSLSCQTEASKEPLFIQRAVVALQSRHAGRRANNISHHSDNYISNFLLPTLLPTTKLK